jgi:CDP-4-dehydro-6-deoxyglucose reductase, E1
MYIAAEGTLMAAKRILYAEAVYDEREINAVLNVLRDRRHELINGPAVRELERKVASLFGKKMGVMVNSGSSANLLAVSSLGLAAGSEVITPALTFSTTVAPLIQCGLVPVFVDVEPDSYVVDVGQIEEMIGPKTQALMIPNLIGNLPEWHEIRAIADRHGLVVIEDSADTVGARYDGQPTSYLTDVSTTSLYASHVMTAGGFGGMLCTNDERLARHALLLRGWGRSSTLTDESESIEHRFGAEVDGIAYDSKFIFTSIGFNFLPSEIAAAFGLVQFEKLDSFIGTRIKNFSRLRSFFTKYERLFVLPHQGEKVFTGWLAFPFIVRSDAPFKRRDLQCHFESNNIQTRTIFTGNILRQPGFSRIERRERAAGYPNADAVMRGGMLIGCHQGLTSSDLGRICDVLDDFVKRF